MKNLKTILALLIISFAFSCSNDDDNNNSGEGSVADIENFANPDAVQALVDIGFIIHEGNTPPNIEGIYQISPRVLEESNIPSDNIGSLYSRINLTFSEQNNTSLKLNFIGEEISNLGNVFSTTTVDDFSENSYITGNGNFFSAFFKVENILNNATAEILYTISGEITENGIANIQQGLLMLDNFGQNTIFILNNQGRVFKDSDNLAENLN